MLKARVSVCKNPFQSSSWWIVDTFFAGRILTVDICDSRTCSPRGPSLSSLLKLLASARVNSCSAVRVLLGMEVASTGEVVSTDLEGAETKDSRFRETAIGWILAGTAASM